MAQSEVAGAAAMFVIVAAGLSLVFRGEAIARDQWMMERHFYWIRLLGLFVVLLAVFVLGGNVKGLLAGN